MSEDKGKYFTTGEFADLCNVKKKTLFHYDEIGLLSPEFRNEKGYRFYTFQQYGVYTVIDLLKTLGMPLKEIKSFLEDKTPDELNSLLARKSKELEKKRAELSRVQRLIDTKIAQIELALATDFSKISLNNEEALPLFLSPSILDCTDRAFIKTLAAFSKEIEHHGLNQGNPIGALIAMPQLIDEDYDNYEYLYIKADGTNSKISIFMRPAGLYVTAYHLGDESTIGTTYKRIKEYLNKNNLQMKGYSYEEYILDEVAVESIDQYVTEIKVQVESL